MSATTFNSPAPPAHMFVYGTLMSGGSRHHMLEAGKIKSIVGASVPGELVDLGEYPGLRLSAYTKERVPGELIEFDQLDAIIARIDEEEGAEFRREIVNVTKDDGKSQFAWIYVMANDASETKTGDMDAYKAKGAGYS